jgi:hypothetical protein
MLLLKRINKYLIENHPIVWHSKFIQLTFTGILFWILSLLFGYVFTTIDSLQRTLFSELYYENYFVFFHVIFCLIVFSIWAIAFFRNNAYKSNYPLQKGYFVYLFFLLFIPMFLIVSAYFPYTYGCKLKTKSFIRNQDLQADIDKLNLGFPFLIFGDYSDISKYDISNRVYPDPYPVQSVYFNRDKGEWSDTSLSVAKGNKYVRYFPDSNKTNNVEVDGSLYQFYLSDVVYLDKDSCKSQSVITRLYTKAELDSPEDYSILNFSSVLIDDHYNGKELYRSKYAPVVYQLVRHNNTSGIEKALNDFIAVGNKYSIENNLNAGILLSYLKAKSFRNFNKTIVNSNLDPEIQKGMARASEFNNKDKLIEYLESGPVFYFQENRAEQLFANFKWSGESFLKQDVIVINLFIALFVVWLFLCFEFSTVRSFLISVPVVGIICILVGILVSFVHDPFVPVLFIFLIIMGATLMGLWSRKIKKGVLAILLNLTYCVAPLFLILLVIIYNESIKRVYYLDRCTGMEQWRTESSILVQPAFLFIFSLIGILGFLPILRKWKAYKD